MPPSPGSPPSTSAYAASASASVSGSGAATLGKDAPDPNAPSWTEQDYYNQVLDWTSCSDGEQCAKITVPMNWADPGGQRIQLAMARIVSTDKSVKHLGSLLTNPGGPGASGVDFLSYMPMLLSQDVVDSYDLVSWDTRGVGESVPVKCYDDTQLNQFFDYWPKSFDDAGLAEMTKVDQDFAAACKQNTGPVLQYVDSESTAKDMDVMRAALGDQKLNYVGFSYGTFLGQLYAEDFPTKVGRMILDGVVDPADSSDQDGYNQAVAFENEARTFVKWCETKYAKSCPFKGNVDKGMNTIKSVFDAAGAKPLKTDYTGRKLSLTDAVTGVIEAMYDTSMWEDLADAIDSAAEDSDGTQLMDLADEYYDRDSDGKFKDNMIEAFDAISCLDSPTDASRANMDAWAAKLKQGAPVLGQYFSYGQGLCGNWPYPATFTPHAIAANGAAPIMVVGTTGDPATPYQQAVKVAGQLASGFLVTYKGEGHTALGNNTCINDTAGAFLVKGTVPAKGTTC
ncbi:MAG: alpha/beta hydrolase [Bifidobacteriaceae bacterium]|nr:alpha/beta hydrolase [Bifidobacteriaceae bacterium]